MGELLKIGALFGLGWAIGFAASRLFEYPASLLALLLGMVALAGTLTLLQLS